jgi:hypothetical protein
VLGFTPLQLSADRDPLAPHAVEPASDALDLGELVRRGLVRNLPERFVSEPPRIEASSPRERAALGYLAANCGICHTGEGALAGLGLDLSYPISGSGAGSGSRSRSGAGSGSGANAGSSANASSGSNSAPARRSRPRSIGRASSAGPATRSRGGSTAALPSGACSRAGWPRANPLSQMPPLGTHRPDADALRLLDDWIRTDLAPAQDPGRRTRPMP